MFSPTQKELLLPYGSTTAADSGQLDREFIIITGEQQAGKSFTLESGN